MVLNDKDMTIISRFRRNARESLTTASRKTGIPISTIYDKLQRYEGSIVRKHTMLLDFAKLGFHLKVLNIIRVQKEDRDGLQHFLNNHPRVNSLYKVSSGQDFIVEGIFRNLHEFSLFIDKVDAFAIVERKEFYIIEDLKQEGFLENQELLEVSLR